MKKSVDKDKLLDVATVQFAEYGFEGARMDKIAEKAGVNKASIYYQIGNKDVLYETVLNRVLAEGASRLETILATTDSADKKLEEFIRQVADVLRKNPLMAKLFMRVQIAQGRHLPESFAQNIVRLLDNLSKILKQGADQGIFHDVDTLTLHFMILGTLSFHLTSSPIRRENKTFPDHYLPDSGDLPEKLVDSVISCVLRAVRKEK